MLNVIWVLMILTALICGALTGKLDEVAKASTDFAGTAVELSLGLVGMMAFWLGMMKVLQEGGLLQSLAKWLKPIMTRLFPGVPSDHPAMSMMIMNMSSNILGLGNAATPFGIKAMLELDKLNKTKGTATNAMVLFLAINTSSIEILPTTMIALRASLGAEYPGSIVLPTLLATTISTFSAILAVRFFQKLPIFAMKEKTFASSTTQKKTLKKTHSFHPLGWLALLSCIAAFGYALSQKASSSQDVFQALFVEWPLLLLIAGILVYGIFTKVKIYDAVVEGGKEGFQIAIRIIPYLVAILVAIGMLRASGAIAILTKLIQPITSFIGMPPEALPMALMRSLSGSGAKGVATEIMQTHGADSFIGNLVSTMQGSTETTFYVIAIYFGAIHIKNSRHTLPACLIADAMGILGALWACKLIFA